MIVGLLGGIGIFLLGMLLMTDGLKALAGEALRGLLNRSIAGPLSGVWWGAVVTALVQSSTATTIATIGFVSAGLLTFAQAIGVVFGANIGTTSTSWIVSQLGFKISLGAIAPPLVLAGVAGRLLGRGRWSHAGMALAGFGLLFIGIDVLQEGMASLAERMRPGDLPLVGENAWGGRFVLAGFGLLMTVVMQSSSAAMTATLAALAAGAIDFDQAAALAIGQNVGTTPKAVIASIGGPAAAKRTALAHVLFNCFTGAVAFLFLPFFVRFTAWITGADDLRDYPTELAFFHTSFNLLGVALLLPAIGPFSRLIERIVPERVAPSARTLLPSVAEVGPVGIEAASRALWSVLAASSRIAGTLLARGGRDPEEDRGLADATSNLDAARSFVHRLGRGEQAAKEAERQISLLHAIDHLERLLRALRERTPLRGRGLSIDDAVLGPHVPPLVRDAEALALAADTAASGPRAERGEALDVVAAAAIAERNSRAIAELRKTERARAFELATAGRLEPQLAVARVEALLWLDRVAHHLWRASDHLARPSASTALEPAEGE